MIKTIVWERDRARIIKRDDEGEISYVVEYVFQVDQMGQKSWTYLRYTDESAMEIARSGSDLLAAADEADRLVNELNKGK